MSEKKPTAMKMELRSESNGALNEAAVSNGRLNPERETVEPRLIKIAGRSISSLIKYQGRGDPRSHASTKPTLRHRFQPRTPRLCRPSHSRIGIGGLFISDTWASSG